MPIGQRKRYGTITLTTAATPPTPKQIINFDDYMRKITELEYVKPIYSKPKHIVLKDGDEEIFDKEWTLYKAKPNVLGYPPILILDSDGYINVGRTNYALQPYIPTKKDEYEIVWGSLPTQVLKQVKKVYGYYSSNNDFEASGLLHHKILHTAVPRLSNLDILDDINWMSFVENEVLSFKAEKDSRIQLVFKATLPRGVEMAYNPHTLMCTDSGTGKSYYYDRAGIRKDKVTPVSLIGTISKESPIYGLVHNQELPLCIEQLESQSAPEILRFMLSFMEMGKGSTSTAYGTLNVTGRCTFIITANPTGYETDKIATFRSLIDALGSNYIALGRRIGIIIYGGKYEYSKVKGLKPLDEVEWNKVFQFFRAVEEYAYPVIRALYKEKEVREWLETLILNYYDDVVQLTKKIPDRSTKEFLETHGSNAHKHIRGGALNCAIVDFLPQLVDLRKTSYAGIPSNLIDQVLKRAEEYLDNLVSINLESISNIPKTLETEKQIAKMIYQRLPRYLKEITIAVKVWKEGATKNKIPIPEELDLQNLEDCYKRKFYKYWSFVEHNLSVSNVNLHNITLEKYFGFRIVKKTDKLYVVRFTDKARQIELH